MKKTLLRIFSTMVRTTSITRTVGVASIYKKRVEVKIFGMFWDITLIITFGYPFV